LSGYYEIYLLTVLFLMIFKLIKNKHEFFYEFARKFFN